MGPARLSDMPPGTSEPKSEQVNARIPLSLRRTIEALAADEGRSLSQMIQRLLTEAIEARQADDRRMR
jgi:hypothetical protein